MRLESNSEKKRTAESHSKVPSVANRTASRPFAINHELVPNSMDRTCELHRHAHTANACRGTRTTLRLLVSQQTFGQSADSNNRQQLHYSAKLSTPTVVAAQLMFRPSAHSSNKKHQLVIWTTFVSNRAPLSLQLLESQRPVQLQPQAPKLTRKRPVGLEPAAAKEEAQLQRL